MNLLETEGEIPVDSRRTRPRVFSGTGFVSDTVQSCQWIQSAAAVVAATVIAASTAVITAAPVIASAAAVIAVGSPAAAAAEEQDNDKNDNPGIPSAKAHNRFLLTMW